MLACDAKDVAEWSEGLIAVLVTDKADNALDQNLRWLKSIFGDRAYCALTRRFRPNDAAMMQGISTIAAECGLPTVALDDILYHCARAPHAAGCRDLHSSADDDRQGRLPQGKSITPTAF